MHTANIDVKMDKDITLDLPANVECTYEIDLPKKFSAELRPKYSGYDYIYSRS